MPSGDTQSATVSYVAEDDVTNISSYITNLADVVEMNLNTERDLQHMTGINRDLRRVAESGSFLL